MSELSSLQNSSSNLNLNETGTVLQESIKLESLINVLKKNWKCYSLDKYWDLQYVNLRVFYAEIKNNSATIRNIYTSMPDIKEFDKLTEVLKNITTSLYFLTEEMLKQNVTELGTIYTNLKMAKSLNHICNRGTIKVLTKIKILENGKVENIWQDLEEIDFVKLDQDLQLDGNFGGMTATFECQVDQSLLEHLKTKIVKLHKKELSKL